MDTKEITEQPVAEKKKRGRKKGTLFGHYKPRQPKQPPEVYTTPV